MKTFQCNPRKLFMVAIACSFAAAATAKAAEESYPTISVPSNRSLLADNAGLLVWRAADFGTYVYLKVFIDGVPVTTLSRNEGYEAIVRPGKHVLSICTGSSFKGSTRFTYRHVNMKRGQTYAFTALWLETDRATLEIPDHGLGFLR